MESAQHQAVACRWILRVAIRPRTLRPTLRHRYHHWFPAHQRMVNRDNTPPPVMERLPRRGSWGPHGKEKPDSESTLPHEYKRSRLSLPRIERTRIERTRKGNKEHILWKNTRLRKRPYTRQYFLLYLNHQDHHLHCRIYRYLRCTTMYFG